MNERITQIIKKIDTINKAVGGKKILDIFKNAPQNFNLISHTDLDGYGCNIVAAMNTDNLIRVKNINYDVIDNTILDMLEEIIKGYSGKRIQEYRYNVVCITDISSNDHDIITMIDKINSMHGLVIIYLIDHHNTAKDIYFGYQWAWIASGPVSATYVFNEWFMYYLNTLEIEKDKQFSLDKNNTIYNEVIEIISRYDTWEWSKNPIDKYNGNENYLNVIFKSFKDPDNFVTNMINLIKTRHNYLDIFETYREEISKYLMSIDKAVDKLSNSAVKFRYTTYIVAIGFCHSPYMSEVANRYLKDNTDVDYIMILNVESRVVSFRSIRNDIDLGQIANKWSCDGNGGGHLQAAGAMISIDDTLNLLEKFYGRLDEDEII